MKITTVETELDYIEFLLLQPSVARSLALQVDYGCEVPESCKAVVACHIFRAEDESRVDQSMDLYVRGFAYCYGSDQFCVVKGMKIALEQASKKFRAIGLESPWTKVIESRLKDAFIGDPVAILKANEDVKRRLQFDPYKVDAPRPTVKDWTKRKKTHHVQL